MPDGHGQRSEIKQNTGARVVDKMDDDMPLNAGSASTHTAENALGIVTTPISVHQRQQQKPVVAGTPDSAVLDRMLELENVIATVKSSLDNHASSYYSVASQIAELNVRIGHMGVANRPAAAASTRISNIIQISSGNGSSSGKARDGYDRAASFSALAKDNSTASKDFSKSTMAVATVDANAYAYVDASVDADASDKEGSDEHYTRIQEMIDSLIKDAGSALNSRPNHHQSMVPNDSTDLPLSCDSMCSPEQLSSVSTVFDDATTSYASPSYAKRPTEKSFAASLAYKASDCAPELHPQRPVSALSMSSRQSRRRSLRQRPQTPVGKARARADPMEADAESDSEYGSVSAANNYSHSYTRSQSRNVNLSLRHSQSRPQSRHQMGSGHYSDRQMASSQRTRKWSGRYRSDTVDTFTTNSSETCVSPRNRISREFRHTPISQTYSGSHAMSESFYAHPNRQFEVRDIVDYEEEPLSHQPTMQQDIVNTRSGQRHEFPQFYAEDSFTTRHHQQQQPGDNSPLSGSNVPLIQRLRNSVTRAVLRSASFVDDSVKDDIAAYSSSRRCSVDSGSAQPLCTRSSTTASEMSPTAAARKMPFHWGPMSPGGLGARSFGTIVNPVKSPSTLQASARENIPVSLSPLWSRRNCGGDSSGEVSRSNLAFDRKLGASHRDSAHPIADLRVSSPRPSAMQMRADMAEYEIRRPDSIEEYDSSNEDRALLENTSSGRQLITSVETNDDNSDNLSGIFGIVSLMYWTLLFTLGALMLDSFLCQVAGKRVMGTVDKISQTEGSTAEDKDAKKKQRESGGLSKVDIDEVNVANTVGRFVRWYIEGPDDMAGNRPSAASSTPSSSLVAGVGRSQPHSLRASRATVKRGSFKHVE
ncbi:hypothetical protein BX661DRAFT_168007 [Kickxella alabastrina]|uniref:uncharacterized protein n=1 Tax=Kickxella alabastrina TaxID=61397 RepID=UPI00221F3865|nr:uncharacterized protein BX661DRAFT_168007 [Kickxella alabastrina]KAI7834793.1 hypothetical protein BX661DRAFT_168007 [Kickxella alabastrina]KAJ1947495.1 hypothetical protein GGF37_000435 [Kickxella alabastrina]